MHHALLSPYRHQSSPIHRLSPLFKVVAAVGVVIAVVLLPRAAWPAYAGVGAALLFIALLSRVPASHLGKRLILVEPFALGVAVLSLFQENGAWIFLDVLTRSTLCLASMVLLAVTTRFSEVIRVLWRLHVPPLLVTTLALMYRYLFVLFDEMGRMQRARKSRTFSESRWFAWRVSATIVGHLFVRTSERAERIYAAMCARGWKT